MTERNDNPDPDRTVALGADAGHGVRTLPLRIDDYILTELLGQGAMGQVYKADQLEPVRRVVAIKLLSATHVDEDLLARFDGERQALARMSHTNVAHVFDAGKSADGQPYFVMEYVPGVTLLDYCRSHALGLAARLHLFRGICSALAHAHQKGIIHRDIKPSNILVTEVDGEAVPKVIDFGLAKAMAGNLADRSLHTHIGTVLGTPAFMSPEQAALTGGEVDIRSDIYALGLVLYQLMTGTLPFRRVGEANSTIEQVLRAVREDEPTRPSARVATLGNDELPAGLDRGIIKPLREDLDWIILKCLAKRPESRYQSANDLLADLDRFAADQPVGARRSTVGYLVTKGVRRYRWPLLVGSVVVVLAAVLGGGWLSSRANAAVQARAAQRFGETVQRMDSRLRIAHTIPAHDISPVKQQVRDDVARLQARLPGLDDWARGPAHYAIGRGLLALDEPEPALAALKAAWDGGYREAPVAYALGLAYGKMYERARQRLSTITDPEQRASRLHEAQVTWRDPALDYLRDGAESGAESVAYGRALIAFYEDDFERARTLAERAIAAEPWLYEAVVLVGNTWSQAARRARESGQGEQALAAYAKAEQAYHRAARIGESDPTPYLDLCSMAGDHLRLIMYGSGKHPEPVFRAGRAACEKAVAIDPQSAVPLARLAQLALIQAQIDEDNGQDSSAAYRKVIATATRAVALDPQASMAYFVAGTAWQRIAIHQLNFTDSSPMHALREAAGMYQKAHAANPNRTDIYNELGNVYSIRGEYLAKHTGKDPMPDLMEAVRQYQTGIRINPRKRIIQSNLAFNYTIIANHLAKIGKDPEPWFDKAFAVYKAILAANPNLLLARINLAATAIHRGDHARAVGEDPLPWWQQAVAELDKTLAVDPDNYDGWNSLAEVQAAQADYLQATGGDPVEAAQVAVKAAHKANAIRATADTWTRLGEALRVLAKQAAGAADEAKLRRQAQAAFGEALKLDPKHPVAKAALAGG